MFVSNASSQAAGSDFRVCSDIDRADLKSGLPLEYLVLSSRAIPALLTKRCTSFDSCFSTSSTKRSIFLVSNVSRETIREDEFVD